MTVAKVKPKAELVRVDIPEWQMKEIVSQTDSYIRTEYGPVNEKLRQRVFELDRDNQMLKADLNGYKSEVECQKQRVLLLEAQIGRLVIAQRIIQ